MPITNRKVHSPKIHNTNPHGEAQPTRVAYLVNSFSSGGIERCVVNLVNNLDRELFEPVVICLTRTGESAKSVQAKTPIFEVGKRPGWDNRAISTLTKILQDQRVDVLHSHNWGTLIEGSLARRRAGVPVHVHTEHGQGLHDNLRGPKQWLRKWANAWAFRRLNTLACCAKCVAPLVEARSGFPAPQILYLPNGVPEPATGIIGNDPNSLREKLGIPAQAIVLGSTGRLVPVKGFELAIEAIARLASETRLIHLVIVGDGESRKSLTELAIALAIDQRVHFVGHQDSVGPWLRMFDMFLNTSLSEAMSLSVLEGMAAGLPIVANDVGDNREILLGHLPSGLILETRTVECLVKAIKSLIEDPTLAKSCRENARRVYQEHFSIQSMIQQHQRTYLSLLAGQSPLRVELDRVSS
jgi:glycosyltransferase involved in cell wall biosynthesis